jgi:hypothetical protein
LAAGFADWLSLRSNQDSPTIWPRSVGRGSQYWGDAFRNRVTKPLKLYVPNTKVMHSFRGSFISMAVGKVDRYALDLITGHAGSTTSQKHYQKPIKDRLPEYVEYVNSVDYGLDIERLGRLWRASMN